VGGAGTVGGAGGAGTVGGAGGAGTAGTGTLATKEILRLPTDLLTASGASSIQHQLVLQMSRDRANPAEPFKSDSELQLGREFTLPTARTFALTGTARASALASDLTVDAITGRPATASVRATSSGRLPGDLAARAASAFDGDPATFWSPGTQNQLGNWIDVSSSTPVTFSSMNLSLVADGRHSVPTRLGLVVDGTKVRELSVPPISDHPKENATSTVRVSFPPVHGSNIKLVVDGVREVKTKDSISGMMTDFPVGVAEVGVAGLRVPRPAAAVPSGCRANLLTIDGKPVDVRVTGSTAAAEAHQALTVSLCGAPVQLGAGNHVLRSAPGSRTGLDLDRLILASNAGGGPSAITPSGEVVDAAAATASTRAAAAAAPTVSVEKSGDTSYTLKVTGARAGSPFWLVLGESLSAGWKATVGSTSLGAPRLVDGYANGWQVTPSASAFTVHVVWTPQRVVWGALALSGVAIPAAVLVELVTWPGLRRRRARRRRGLSGAVAGSGGLGSRAGSGGLGSLGSRAGSGGLGSSGGLGGSAPTGRLAGPLSARADLPSLEPLRTVSGPATTRLTVLVTLGAALLAGILIKPIYAPVVALLALLALRVPRWRLVLRAGGAVCLAACAAYMMEVQARYHLPTSGDWVSAFRRVDGLSWLAIVLLAVDVAVAFALRRSGPGSDPLTAGDAAPTGPSARPGSGTGIDVIAGAGSPAPADEVPDQPPPGTGTA
jgi:hypothetical protein